MREREFDRVADGEDSERVCPHRRDGVGVVVPDNDELDVEAKAEEEESGVGKSTDARTGG